VDNFELSVTLVSAVGQKQIVL